MSPTLNVNLTLFVIPCKKQLGIIDLQCCNYCHLLSDFSSKFQSSMTIIFHCKIVRMQNIPNFVSIIGNLDELKVSWDDSIVNLFMKKCH